MLILRNCAFYIAFLLGSVVSVLAGALTLLAGGRGLHAVGAFWSGLHRAAARLFLGIRVEERGSRPDYPVLYALRHESMFEAIDLPYFLDRPVVFAKEELLRIPGWGPVGARYGLVPVARSKGASGLRAMLAAARSYSASGRPLAIFPEGTRIAHGTQAPLQSGFSGLYKMLNLPVVPVAVNSGLLYQRLWKKPGTIIMQIGEPIPAGLPREEIEARVAEAINLLNRS